MRGGNHLSTDKWTREGCHALVLLGVLMEPQLSLTYFIAEGDGLFHLDLHFHYQMVLIMSWFGEVVDLLLL